MTMYPGAYASADPNVPADATGVYPALAGYTPMSTGRRIAVALVDVVIVYGVLAVSFGVAYMVPGVSGYGPVYAGIVTCLIAQLWAMFAKSSRVSGVFMGAQYVDVTTGLPSGGKAFGKWMLTGLISGISLGIAPLIMYLATVQEPLKRNWFDRSVGLILVDTRTGRRPGDPLPQQQAAPPPPPAIAAVAFPGAPAAPWAPRQAQPAADYAQPPHSVGPAVPQQTPGYVRPQQAPGFGVPQQPQQVPGFGGMYDPSGAFANSAPSQTPTPSGASRLEWTPAPADSVAPAIVPITSDGGLITSTPTSASVPTPQPVAAPSSSIPPPVIVRDMHSVDAAHADRTMLAADSSLVAPAASPGNVYLDDNTVLGLEPPTVVGRNPLAPGSHPDAVRHVVEDRLASKTHLLVGRDDLGPWVIDLHSTNGVAVAKVPGAEPVRIEAGRKVHLGVGATAAFGEHRLTVR